MNELIKTWRTIFHLENLANVLENQRNFEHWGREENVDFIFRQKTLYLSSTTFQRVFGGKKEKSEIDIESITTENGPFKIWDRKKDVQVTNRLPPQVTAKIRSSRGFVTVEQLVNAEILTADVAEAVFKSHDLDANGFLDVMEFVQMMCPEQYP